MGVSVRRQGPKVSISLRLSLIHDEHEKIEVWSSIIDVVEVNCCLSLNPIFAVLIHLSDSRRRSCSTTVGRSALRRAGMDSFGSPVARPARTDDEDDDDDDDDEEEDCRILSSSMIAKRRPLLPSGRTTCKPLVKVPQSALCHAWPHAHSSCPAMYLVYQS